MDKCIGCCFYDRQNGSNTDSRGVSWGQCRRTAPALHPINQKSFMIEGVWPHVRDDDWCGEFKAASMARRAEARPVEAIGPGPLLPISTGASFGQQRTASVSALPQSGVPRELPSSIGSLTSTGRGGD